MQSVGQKKTQTFREHCNSTITRVLSTSGANYKINNFSRRFPTSDLTEEPNSPIIIFSEP